MKLILEWLKYHWWRLNMIARRKYCEKFHDDSDTEFFMGWALIGGYFPRKCKKCGSIKYYKDGNRHP